MSGRLPTTAKDVGKSYATPRRLIVPTIVVGYQSMTWMSANLVNCHYKKRKVKIKKPLMRNIERCRNGMAIVVNDWGAKTPPPVRLIITRV